MIRFFDFVFSFLALVLLSPFMLPAVVLLRCTGEGEVFFLQERIGYRGRKFKLIKFATMLKNSPNIGTGTITIKGDPRILPFGKILRKTKINELPQLLNILFGDMSFIGPRPLTERNFNAYSISNQNVIKRVKPGLSGIGSIIFRGEEDILQGTTATVDYYERVITPYKGSLEEWFVNNKSFYIYFVSIFITVYVVIFPKSAIAWYIFNDLPEPPDELKKSLNFEN